jgi:hypothetical protein
MPNPLNWTAGLNAEVTDIGTADSKVFVSPTAGFLRRLDVVLNGAITGANETITVSIDGTALSPTLVIAFSGSAAGTYATQEFYATVKKGSRIVVANDGASTGVTKAAYTITLGE